MPLPDLPPCPKQMESYSIISPILTATPNEFCDLLLDQNTASEKAYQC